MHCHATEIQQKLNGIWLKSGNPTVYDYFSGYSFAADSQRVVAGVVYVHRRMLPFVTVMLNTALV